MKKDVNSHHSTANNDIIGPLIKSTFVEIYVNGRFIINVKSVEKKATMTKMNEDKIAKKKNLPLSPCHVLQNNYQAQIFKN